MPKPHPTLTDEQLEAFGDELDAIRPAPLPTSASATPTTSTG